MSACLVPCTSLSKFSRLQRQISSLGTDDNNNNLLALSLPDPTSHIQKLSQPYLHLHLPPLSLPLQHSNIFVVLTFTRLHLVPLTKHMANLTGQ